MFKALAFLSVLFSTPAYAECASGYSQISVPLCQLNPPTCGLTTTVNNTMAVQSPCTNQLITTNQLTTPALSGVSLTDANATVGQVSFPMQVKAPGMLNVEVWTHGSMAVRLTGSSGVFTGNLNLTSERAGPLHVRIFAYDVAAGGTPTVKLEEDITLLVTGTRPAIPTPALATAAGFTTLGFSDHFTSLSSTPCKPGTGVWPNCTNPTASDGFKWYENLFNGQDFGDCANEHTDSVKYNPYTILPMGGLRIRSTYDPTYVDPYGFGRTQYCGTLSSKFKDGTNSMTFGGDGYYVAHIMVPHADCGANNACGGATWDSFWMLGNRGGTTSSDFEEDMVELFGNNDAYYQAYTHTYNGATDAPGPYSGNPLSITGSYSGVQSIDLTWDFHDIAMLIKGSGTNGGYVCSALDGVYLACSPMGLFASPNQAVTANWALMLELASGSGYTFHPQPSNQNDMFVDWVAVWH